MSSPDVKGGPHVSDSPSTSGDFRARRAGGVLQQRSLRARAETTCCDNRLCRPAFRYWVRKGLYVSEWEALYRSPKFTRRLGLEPDMCRCPSVLCPSFDTQLTCACLLASMAIQPGCTARL